MDDGIEPNTIKVVKRGEDNYSLSVATDTEVTTWNDVTHDALVTVLEKVQEKYGTLEIIGEEYLQ